MRLIKLIFKPLDWFVMIILFGLTAIVWAGTIGMKTVIIIFTPLTWLTIKLAKLINKKIEHYKNKDSWKEYYDK